MTTSNSWWKRLGPARRQAWLDAAGSDRRKRTPDAAYQLKARIQSGASIIRTYTTSTGDLVGQVIRDGQIAFAAAGFNTEAELRAALSAHGFSGIPVLHAEFLIDLANEIYDEDCEQERTSRSR